jgi:hypothetical protein
MPAFCLHSACIFLANCLHFACQEFLSEDKTLVYSQIIIFLVEKVENF